MIIEIGIYYNNHERQVLFAKQDKISICMSYKKLQNIKLNLRGK